MSQQINLFNPIFLKQKKIFTALPMAKALGLMLLGVLALALYGKQRVASLQKEANASAAQLAQKQARQSMANAQFAPRQKDAALAGQIAAAQAELAALRKVSDVLRNGEFGNTLGYSSYFKAFARQSVDGLWLTGVAITGAGNEIGLHGRALQPTLVPAYLGRLAREKVMQGKSFSSLQVNQAQRQDAAGKDGAATEPAPFIDFSLQSSGLADTPGVPGR